jgi:hypothetical protein
MIPDVYPLSIGKKKKWPFRKMKCSHTWALLFFFKTALLRAGIISTCHMSSNTMGQILEIAPNPCRVSIWVDNHDHPKKSIFDFDI